jgi:hypothetical protein
MLQTAPLQASSTTTATLYSTEKELSLPGEVPNNWFLILKQGSSLLYTNYFSWHTTYYIVAIDTCGKAFELWFGGVWFEYRPEHRMSWLKFSSVPSGKSSSLTGSLWRRQSQQSFNTLTPFNFLFYSLRVSAPTGHPQVRYTVSYYFCFWRTILIQRIRCTYAIGYRDVICCHQYFNL